MDWIPGNCEILILIHFKENTSKYSLELERTKHGKQILTEYINTVLLGSFSLLLKNVFENIAVADEQTKGCVTVFHHLCLLLTLDEGFTNSKVTRKQEAGEG